jgi:hypothetical protein
MPLVPGTADVLPLMPAPTILQNATGAGASIAYSIVPVNAAGVDGDPSLVATAYNNAATPNNTISWVAIPGAAAYRVLKAGALLATVGAGVTSYVDNAGVAGATYAQNVASPLAPIPTASMFLDGAKPTYSAAKVGLVPAATPTDIFTITGSASKIVRVTHIEITATTTAATAAAIDVLLLKRSTADTGGTTTGSPTPVPHDSANPAVSATVLAYTANPGALGTIVGTAIRNSKLVQTLATYTATDYPAITPLVWDFGNRPGQGIVLRGIADVLAINLNGVSVSAGALFNISAEWSEE